MKGLMGRMALHRAWWDLDSPRGVGEAYLVRGTPRAKIQREKYHHHSLKNSRTIWIEWPVSFQSNWQEGWSEKQEVNQRNVGFPKPRRKWSFFCFYF